MRESWLLTALGDGWSRAGRSDEPLDILECRFFDFELRIAGVRRTKIGYEASSLSELEVTAGSVAVDAIPAIWIPVFESVLRRGAATVDSPGRQPGERLVAINKPRRGDGMRATSSNDAHC